MQKIFQAYIRSNISGNLFYKNIFFFVIFPLFFSLLNISKVFYIPDCFAFDMNDDANHTFVNLTIWRSILADGEWPMMNVYNNFGTPLIGDGLTYPLSPLSLSYVFFPDILAMTINRVIITFVSLLLLFVYYRKRLLDVLSMLASLGTFYAPGFLWHSAHHHFQLTIVLFTAFLILQDLMNERPSRGAFIGMCCVSILMFISVSFNMVAWMSLYLFVQQLILSQGKWDRRCWLTLCAFICGAVFVFPDIMFFSQAAACSMRRFAEYPVIIAEGPNKIFWTPVVTVGLFVMRAYRKKCCQKERTICFLGLVATLFVLLLKSFPFLSGKLSFLGATDIIRVTWLTNIFLFLGTASLFLRWWHEKADWRWEAIICILALGYDAYHLPVMTQEALLPWQWGVKITYGTILAVLLVGMILDVRKDRLHQRILSGLYQWKSRYMVRIVAIVVAVNLIAVFLYYGFGVVFGFYAFKSCRFRSHPYYSVRGSEQFGFELSKDKIVPFSRIAYDFDTLQGWDLRSARERLFGSGARSTIMVNADLAMMLFKGGLIQFDNYTGAYHFSRPWKERALQSLGISYVAQDVRDEHLETDGWKLVAQEAEVFLYQNPLATSVVYLRDKYDKIVPVAFEPRGNGLNIKLPPILKETEYLIISLLHLPGWQALVDGKPRMFSLGEGKFLVLPVSPVDHFVKIRYAPFAGWHILLSGLLAMTIPLLMIRIWRLNTKLL